MKILESNLPTVSLIFPVRNRAAYLPLFLENIYNLSYPKKLLDIIVRINDSNDDSEKILKTFQKQHEHEYNKIYISTYNLETPTYDSNRYSIIGAKFIQSKSGIKAIQDNQTHKVYKNLAKHRNSLLLKASGDFVFSVDTDIMLKPETLNVLLSQVTEERQYISAHICNGYVVSKQHGISAYDFTNALYYDEIKDKHTHYTYETMGLVECSFSGAVFIVSKKLYKSGSLFDFHPLGEDFCFCDGLIKRGYKIYCDTNHRLAHCMDLQLLEKYKNGEWVY